MKENQLKILNKATLIKIILDLQKENRLLKNQNKLYMCMECGKDFEQDQVKVEDSFGNVLCPYCGSGDINEYKENNN